MESTETFARALRLAYDQRKNRTETDRKNVGQILATPTMRDRFGRPFYAMKRLQLRVHELMDVGLQAIDFSALVQWIKDHWLQILQAAAAILTILMFI